MAIDRGRAQAMSFPPLTVEVERGRLRQFAGATGQSDPIYTDIVAATDAGHPDLPVPLSFFFSLELEAPDPLGYLEALGVDPRRVLHGEQSFSYDRMAYAGDTLTLTSRIFDAYTKRGGALDFIVRQTDVTRGEVHVAAAETVLVVVNPEGQ